MDILFSLNPHLQKLNIELLIPYLNQYHVLTPGEREDLQIDKPNSTKVQSLLNYLDRKTDDEQKDVIKAIYQSSLQSGGGMHCKIIKLLKENGIICEQNL